MKIENLLVLDTETTGDFGQPLIYDFAYKIVTLEGELLFKREALVSEIFDCRFAMDKAFYSSKIKAYIERYENGEIEKVSFEKLIKEFVKATRKYKVSTICAYNLAFDIKAINGTMRMTYAKGQEEEILEKLINQKNKRLLCIWNLACETILNTDEYRAYADEHNFVSEKGNYQSNAEVAYRYIKDLPDFEEKHTAMADVDIEIEILLTILNQYKGNITYGLHNGSWHKIQKKRV